MMKRRSFLIGLGAVMTAPMIVRAEALMPVKVMLPSGPLRLFVDPAMGFLNGPFDPSELNKFGTIQAALDYAANCKVLETEIILGSGDYRNAVAIAPPGEHSLVCERGALVDLSGSQLRFRNERNPVIFASTLSVVNVSNVRIFSSMTDPTGHGARATSGAQVLLDGGDNDGTR